MGKSVCLRLYRIYPFILSSLRCRCVCHSVEKHGHSKGDQRADMCQRMHSGIYDPGHCILLFWTSNICHFYQFTDTSNYRSGLVSWDSWWSFGIAASGTWIFAVAGCKRDVDVVPVTMQILLKIAGSCLGDGAAEAAKACFLLCSLSRYLSMALVWEEASKKIGSRIK